MKKFFISVLLVLSMTVFMGCVDSKPDTPISDSGVSKITALVKVGADNLTTEQSNVKNNIEEDNRPGVTKYLYVISAYSGDVIIYSTVKGKVTSSGKRLNPYTVVANNNLLGYRSGFDVKFGDYCYKTVEVLQDDGTYGHSIPYLYWWDTKGVKHKHYVSGGQIVHISDKPITIGKVIINMDLYKD